MLKLLNDALAGRSYLVGDHFTLADLAVCGFFSYLRFMQYDFSRYANVNAWSERCLSRPAAQKAQQP
jgi:glutathione S-transferase